MMRLTFLAMLLALALPGNARQISGRVVDQDGLAVPGVNVLVEGTSRGTATDTEGRWRLDGLDEGVVSLRFSAIGFRTEVRTVRLGGSEVVLDVVLNEQALLADEVVVTASRREQSALSVPVSISVLSADELTRRNTVVLDEALRTLSGVQVLGNQINVRGSSGFAYNTGSRVLLMVDGMPLLTPESDGVPLEAIPASEIRRVELLKGPGSALYGGGALGGVINVITREMPEDAAETRVRTFAGVWDPVRHQVWRDGWVHGNEYRPFWGINASHARRASPTVAWWANLSLRRDAGYMALSGRDVLHGFGKVAWQASPSLRVETLVGIMARERDNFIFWDSARNVLQPGRVSFGDPIDPTDPPTGISDDFVRQITLLPVIRHLVSPSFYHEVRLRAFGMLVQQLDNETGKRKSVQDGTLGIRYGAEWQGNWFASEDRRFVFGLTRDEMNTKSSFFVTTDGDRIGGQPETAAFVHVEQDAGNHLQLVGGLRLDHYQIDATDTERRLSPKISLAWSGWKQQTFRAAFGDGFRVPSFAERFTDNRDFLPIIRNLSLRPETSRSVEVGWRGVTSGLMPGAFSWDLSLFYNTYRGLIEPRLVTAEQAFQFINL
ncbi:MAG: TonB-dependent receptor, partial [Bacteroidetes bacterium]|nr:TonB-dependent receptor [Bacteroidota bacterium]